LLPEGFDLFDQLLFCFSAGGGHLLSREDRFCVRLYPRETVRLEYPQSCKYSAKESTLPATAKAASILP
jgi:hypothetical protein